MEVGLRESCLAEKLFEQMQGAEAEVVETSPKSRRRCCRVDVRYRQPNKHTPNTQTHNSS